MLRASLTINANYRDADHRRLAEAMLSPSRHKMFNSKCKYECLFLYEHDDFPSTRSNKPIYKQNQIVRLASFPKMVIDSSWPYKICRQHFPLASGIGQVCYRLEKLIKACTLSAVKVTYIPTNQPSLSIIEYNIHCS